MVYLLNMVISHDFPCFPLSYVTNNHKLTIQYLTIPAIPLHFLDHVPRLELPNLDLEMLRVM